MMATRAIHVLGDISRDEPSLAIIYGEVTEGWIGEWATGLGMVNVLFPKASTRELTTDERTLYAGKFIDTAGMVRPIVIPEASDG
jgi:hypothetical protein